MNINEQSKNDLEHIRKVMDNAARFLSLSGWSGVWAGVMALAGSYWAIKWQQEYNTLFNGADFKMEDLDIYNNYHIKFISLTLIVFLLAAIGAFLFTYLKNKKEGIKIWNRASQKMLVSLAIPVAAGAVFSYVFYINFDYKYIVPAMLVLYGMALINSSRYTLSQVRYLGLCEVLLGCIALFSPVFGLYFWAFGFGALHIIYGLIMWKNNRAS